MAVSRRAALLATATGATAVALLAATAVAAPDWDLTTSDFNRTAWQKQAYVANGYIGQRIPAEGFGYREVEPNNLEERDGTQGWPLFTPRQASAIVAGFYDQQPETAGTNFAQDGGQQPMATLPTFSSLYLTVNNATLSRDTPDEQLSNWEQSMSIQDGLVRTSYDWTPEGATAPLRVSYQMLAHRVWPNVAAVRLTVQGLNTSDQVAFTDVFDGAGAWRTDFVSSGPVENTTNTIHTAVRPYGIPNVTAYEVSVMDLWPRSSTTWQIDDGSNCIGPALSANESTTSQCYRIVSGMPENGVLDAVKYVGIATSDAYPEMELETALQAATNANLTGWDAVLSSHREAWDNVWSESDIEIPGEEYEEIQLATRASMFHLLTNLRNGSEPHGLGDNSIAPAGLTSDSYSAQIFWDAETWMYPSLLALFPDYAENIVDFRFRQLGAAQQNAAANNLSGAIYPWVAGRFGNCTGIGPCVDYQYHLNSDIALAAWQYYAATNNQTWLEEKGYPIVRGTADMFASFVQRNETADGGYNYVTLNTSSADEYASFVNNTGLNNGALMITLQQATELGSIIGAGEAPANWSDIIDHIIIPTSDSGIIKTYDKMNGSVEVKQADVVLLHYPYEFNWPTSGALRDLDFYSGANSPDGPAMTWSIYSILAAELSPMGCASWSYFLQAAQPYSRAPYYQFSEQVNDVWADNGGTNPAFTFLTGHGGFLQSLTHGFTGYRFRIDRLFFDPSLPPQFTNYTVKGLKYHGSSFDLQVTTEQLTITHKRGSDGMPVEIAEGNDKAGNYTLAVGESLSVPTRSTTGTLIEGNIAQCRPVLANDTAFHQDVQAIVPGEYALRAVDGSNATVWQPATADPSSLVVDLGSEQTITAFHFNWNNEPPQSYSVAVANSSDGFGNATAVAEGSVNITAPYDFATSLIVQIDLGNLTDVTLPEPVTGRYVQLTVEGTYGSEGLGPTVGEFAVIGA
ncbi:alpha,alpha-trehalase ATH1 [Rhodotorula paludigena]|uniref:alpha,alpha-trehalase ATH1 n=1 Tax=Rhodotorula paludigena TaxID=86838 RepID=UPI0031816911